MRCGPIDAAAATTSGLSPLRGGSTHITSGRRPFAAKSAAAAAASPQKNSTFSIPLRRAFSLASAMASGTVSAPMTLAARPPGHDLGDGARAAVQVQHRLVPGQSREVHSGIVQHLRHVMVHLIKGRHAQPKGQAAQGILQHVHAPQGAVFTAQYSPGGLGVHAQHHTHGVRPGLPHK